MRSMFVLLAVAAIHMPAAAQRGGQAALDIIRIADQFIISSVAAKKCAVIDDKTEKAFLANLLAVRMRKARVLKERHPDIPEAQLVEQDVKSMELVRDTAEKVITQYGCQSIEVKQLIQRYHIQASLPFGR